jgi:hypothetical protein
VGSLGPRYTVSFRARRPERPILWCAYGPGQNLTRLVRVRYTLDPHPLLMLTAGRAFRQFMATSSFNFYSILLGVRFPLVLARSFSGSCLLPYVVFRHRHYLLSSVPTSFIIHPQLSALALRLVPQDPSRWPNWIVATSTELSTAGATTEHILDFLEIAVEEVNGADLLPAKKCEPASRFRIDLALTSVTDLRCFKALKRLSPLSSRSSLRPLSRLRILSDCVSYNLR